MTQAVNLAQYANNSPSWRNRIINGAMMIDQRNAGTAKTLSASTITYTTDRFGVYCATGTGHTYQQVTDAPAGFVNSLKFTVGTGGTPSAGQQNVGPYQVIEGYNTTDFNWGSASAQAVTLSFWVKSSLTGTFCVSIQSSNVSTAYSYVATYSISNANTWEYKTISIPANTYNTPYTNNNGGVGVFFGLGSGSSYTTTANTWTLGDFKFATGSVNILGTNGATFYITGVQLEVGTTATNFDYRPYGTELALCQRYYWRSTQSSGTSGGLGFAIGNGTNYGRWQFNFPVQMRTPPTIGFSGLTLFNFGTSQTLNSITGNYSTVNNISVDGAAAGSVGTNTLLLVYQNNAASYADASAEL